MTGRKLANPEPPNFSDQHQNFSPRYTINFQEYKLSIFERIITCGDDCRGVPTNYRKRRILKYRIFSIKRRGVYLQRGHVDLAFTNFS